MNDEQQLKLQAFFDGELPEKESSEIAAWLASDADATALLKELRNTRQALANSEPELKLPETREFYWSKIQREIERTERVAERTASISIFARLRRVLIPLGAAAVIVAAGLIAFQQFAGSGHPSGVNAILADAGAFTYRDEAEGMTVVWLSYPAENGVASAASSDTLQQK